MTAAARARTRIIHPLCFTMDATRQTTIVPGYSAVKHYVDRRDVQKTLHKTISRRMLKPHGQGETLWQCALLPVVIRHPLAVCLLP